jgi:hypothetical protein
VLRIRQHKTSWGKTPAIFLSLAAVSIVVLLCVYLGVAKKEVSVEDEQATAPIVLSSTLLDFGLVPLNGSAVRQLVLRNDGTDPLRAALSVAGANYRIKPDHLLLHPGIAARVSISVRADRPGSLDDELRIAFEEQEGDPLVVALEGQAHADAAGEGLRQGPISAEPRPTELAGNTQGPGEAPGRAHVPSRLPAPQPGVAAAPGVHPDFSGVVTQADRPGATSTAGEPTTTRASRAAAAAAAGEPGPPLKPADRGSIGLTVLPPNPNAQSNVPFDDQRRVTESIGQEEAKRAHKMRSMVDRELEDRNDLPDREEIEAQDDEFDRQPFTPTLAISGISNVRLIGSVNTFYPQVIQVDGTEAGGPISLRGSIQFPRVSWAMGDSMDFKQTAPAVGSYDRNTGQVELHVPVNAVDFDNRAAPLPLVLTTGTVVARDETGLVVSMTGSARSSSGVLKLVGIQKIPVGYGNNAEQQLVVFELAASLEFGSAPTRLAR